MSSLSPCPIARGVAAFGDGWSLLILRDALGGATRFDTFRRNLGIAPTVLTKRLAALTTEGLLEKARYQDNPPREEYRLTEAGRDLLPILLAMASWGRRHRSGGELVRYIDAESGVDLDPVVVDATTGAPIGTRAIRIEIPPDVDLAHQDNSSRPA